MDGDVGFKDAQGESDGGVHRQDAQELFAQGDLLRRQLRAEDHVAVHTEPETDTEQQGAQHRIDHEEQSVEPCHALPVILRLVAGIVVDIGAAETEGQEIEIGDDGQHRLVHTELAGAKALEHDGGIDEGDNGGKTHGHVA